MLAREHRLRRSADIARVLRHGRRKHARHFVLRWSRNRVGQSRCTVIVSKKYDRRAVVRNRARRRVLEVIRLEYPRIPVGFDILITVQSDISALTPAELKSEIVQLFRLIEV